MIRTFRFVFKNEKSFHGYFANHDIYEYYVAVFVLDVEEQDGEIVSENDVLSTSAIGVLPKQLTRLRWEGVNERDLNHFPLFKRLVREHFENQEERFHNVLNGVMFGPLENGLGPYAPEEIPEPLEPQLVRSPPARRPKQSTVRTPRTRKLVLVNTPPSQ